jgi:hypothetical protein
MSRREEFNLVFSRVLTPQGNNCFYCDSILSSDKKSLVFATVLSGYNEVYSEYLIENIDLALAGSEFEEFHQPDSLTDNFVINISPPNVLISTNNYSVNLQIWKELMQEWLIFLNT